MRLLARTLVLTGVVLSLQACGPEPPDEQRIRAVLDSMTQALEDRQASEVLEPLADDFVGETWDLDRRALRMILRREMLAHDRLRARLFDVDIELLSPDRATVSFQVLLTGGSGIVPREGRWFQVETGWRQDADWRLISARWESVIGR